MSAPGTAGGRTDFRTDGSSIGTERRESGKLRSRSCRFDILKNTEYETYYWKLQIDGAYVCKSARSAFSNFQEAAQDARKFRKLIGIKATVPHKPGPS